MFDMTNDSHLFRTAAQLEDGFGVLSGRRATAGSVVPTTYVPLYEGKMASQAFDHRAASVVVNPENLNRPAQPREATLDEHADPCWLPPRSAVLGAHADAVRVTAAMASAGIGCWAVQDEITAPSQ